MAGWISSRLKVAEDFLHQIDQQAADSLRKNEKLRSEEQLGLETLPKSSENRPLLKEQLKKKPIDNHDSSISDHSSNLIIGSNGFGSTNGSNKDKVAGDVALNVDYSKPSPVSLSNSDWTELLSAPVKKDTGNGSKGAKGGPRVRVAPKDGRKKSSLGNLVALDVKKNQKNQSWGLKSGSKSDAMLVSKVNGVEGRESVSGDVVSSTSTSSVRTSTSSTESRNDKESVDTKDVERKDLNADFLSESTDEIRGRDAALDGLVTKEALHPKDKAVDKYQSSGTHASTYDKKKKLNVGSSEVGRPNIQTVVGGLAVASRMSAPTNKGSSSPSSEESDSETESSSSDSEKEREREKKREERRKRRQQILAEKSAAKAIEAIKVREDNLARLEGEKQSLEKILEEQSKEQVVEASKLQTTMMEVMDAVELEKQKHNNTRMETLASLIKLETKHADLTRSLASAQKNLEVEITEVSDLRQLVDLKEAALEELRRKFSSYHPSGKEMAASKGVEFERDILETEYSFLTDKVGQLQEKAKTLQSSIESTQQELENPTDMEMELKRRLSQLTDRLIQKQAQVEALSSEKAMLQFKIEAVSRSLEENSLMLMDSIDIASTSSGGDVEAGVWKLPNAKVRHTLEEQILYGKQHLGSFVRQLDYLFCTGAVFLRRNSTARTWAIVYFVCLHLWVIYILMSHSPVSEDAGSGAVISLENINKTGSV